MYKVKNYRIDSKNMADFRRTKKRKRKISRTSNEFAYKKTTGDYKFEDRLY